MSLEFYCRWSSTVFGVLLWIDFFLIIKKKWGSRGFYCRWSSSFFVVLRSLYRYRSLYTFAYVIIFFKFF
jgi:hypothetical protein